MKHYLSSLCLLIILTGLFSCKKEGAVGPAGPSGPVLTGNVSGFVVLDDQFGNKTYVNVANSKVVINGRTDTTLTDSLGKFTLNNLSTGTYSLNITRTGFGSMIKNFSFTGGGNTLLSDTRLAAIPNFSVSSVTATSTGTTVTVTGNISSGNSFNTQVVVFVGKTTSTSANPSTYLLSSVVTVSSTGTSFTAKFTTDQLYSAGITTGLTAYIAAYGISNTQSASSYEDLTTGQTVYTAINPGNATTSITVP
jgi:hypothetical protein